MPRLRATLAFAVLLAPAFVSGQSGAPALRFVYPNAKALISINWQRIRELPAGAIIRDKWLNAGFAAAIPGIELLDDIDRVVISSPGNEAVKDTGNDAAVEPGDAPLLIAVEGHFDAAQVRRLFTRLGSKPQAYNSFQVYRPQGKDAKDMAYVLFDPGTILFGDAPSLFAALDRNQFGPPAAEPGSIVARAAGMDAAYDVWLIITTPDVISNDRLANLFAGGEWTADAQGFEAGVNLRSGLTADVTVRFASEAVAKRVVAEMTKLTAVLSRDKKAESQMQAIAKKLKFSSDGPAARISLRLTSQELEKSAQALIAARETPAAAHPAPGLIAPTQAANPTPVTSAPSKPAVIRIEGLDEGPREIPYPDQHH
jgi:hypothetical protein